MRARLKRGLKPGRLAYFFICGLCVPLSVVINTVQAQSPAPGKTSRNLDSQSAAAATTPADIGQCRLEQVVPSQEMRKLNVASVCKINAAQATGLLAKPGAILIDSRSRNEVILSRIRNSLPMSLSELRRRPDLRSASLVVIGSGKEDAALFDQCTTLREAGYKNLSVLAGGIASWQANGGEVVGEQQAVQSLSRLSARELLQRVVAKDATILLAPESKPFASLIKDAIAIPSVDAAHIAAAAQQGRPGMPIVVVFSTAPAHEILFTVSRSARVPVFSFTGKPAEFEAVVRQHLALWERSAGGQRLKCPGL